MFGKKQPSESQPLLTLLVLTSDMLIEGTSEVGKKSVGIRLGGEATSAFHALKLTNAKLHPIGTDDAPPRSLPVFMAWGEQIIAQIPHSDTPISEYDVWKEYKKSLTGTFYFGPYVISGTMMFLDLAMIKLTMPMVDVRITSRIPGARFSELNAPFAIVNTHWLAGYEPQ
jgi:hypothetical protein